MEQKESGNAQLPSHHYSWTKSAEVAYKILEGKDFEKETLISTFAIDASNVSEYSDSDWQ